MSKRDLVQQQNTNIPLKDITFQRQATKLSESTTSQEWLPDTATDTFDEPGVGFDFSKVPAHTNMMKQTTPLPKTQTMVPQSSGNEAADFVPCPTSLNEEPSQIHASAERSTESAVIAPGITSNADMAEPTTEPVGLEPETAPAPIFAEQTTESAKTAPWNTPDADIAESTEESVDPDTQTNPSPGKTAGPALLVEDSATKLESGQMKKSEFLSQLRVEVTRTVEAALSGTGRTTEDCPYLNHWFDFYSRKNSRHVERAIHRYAPEASSVTTVSGYISFITQRAGQATKTWVTTGEITGLPEGVPINSLEESPAQYNGRDARSNKPVMFKAREGGNRAVENPLVIKKELGKGHPLDSGVRSRMETAFGADFAKVRTHTDTRAASLSNRYNARAFTVGEHIAFGSGEYQPGTLLGDTLIAHELAHVVQQSGASINESSMHGDNSAGYSTLESDADTAAGGIAASLWCAGWGMLTDLAQNTVPRLRSGLQLQRCARTPAAASLPASSRILSIFAMPATPPSYIVPPGGRVEPGPLYLPWGQYQEYIQWRTINSNGFIVQEMTTTYNPTACPGGTVQPGEPTPHFWEAWQVDGTGRVSPSLGEVNDAWTLPRHENTQGNWSAIASVYFVEALDPNAHFAVGNVPDSGHLLSTQTQPNNLGSSLLGRRAGATWDCEGTHTST